MKRKASVVWLIVVLISTACQSSAQVSIPTSTPFPTTTSLPTETATVEAFKKPKITATPIVANVSTNDELEQLVENLYPLPCIGYNYAKAPETDLNHASALNFIEADILPDPKQYWVSEIADNADGSRQAFVACDPEFCQDKIYVRDDKTKKVYEIDWDGRMPWRPIEWVTWINNDILAFFQSSNPNFASLMVIDFDKIKVLYQAVVYPDYYCATSTPTP